MKYVKLNPKANIFHDAATGLTLVKGEVKEISEIQSRSGKIKVAIQSGHLLLTTPTTQSGKDEGSEFDLKEEAQVLLNKFKVLVKEGVVADKLVKSFNLDELKAIANELEIEVEEGDTKAVIVEAILDEVGEG